MKRIQLKAFGKINLCLDVLKRLDNGYHQLEMVMQQILLHDDVAVKWTEALDEGQDRKGEAPVTIRVSTNKPWLPRDDERNLAYKAAAIMTEHYGKGLCGEIRIDIKKRIPVAAGLAGGSSNGAAVLHALNVLWNLGLDVRQLCALGSSLGSEDVYKRQGTGLCY